MGVEGVTGGKKFFEDILTQGTSGPDGTRFNDRRNVGSSGDIPPPGDDDTGGPGGPPDLPMPELDPGEIAILLMQLQSKMAEERVRTGKEDIQQRKTEMDKLFKERMEKMEEYWDKMEEAARKSTGFWGKFFSGLKKLFKGDFKGALKDIGTAFKENPFTGATFLIFMVVVGPASLLAGPLGLLAGAAIGAILFGPSILSDPEVVKMIAQATGWSEETAQKVCMGVSIAIAVVTAAIMLFSGFGAAGALGVALKVFSGISAAVSAVTLIERGVHNKAAAEATSEGLDAFADADDLKALYEKAEQELKRNMNDVKEVMESIVNEMRKAMEIIMNQGSVQLGVANI